MKQIKSREDCSYFGAKTVQKPCGTCEKNCLYSGKNYIPKEYSDLENRVATSPQIIWDATIRCYRILYCNSRGICVKGMFSLKKNAEVYLNKNKEKLKRWIEF